MCPLHNTIVIARESRKRAISTPGTFVRAGTAYWIPRFRAE